jgi:pilus assembly protein CpaE
LEKYAILTAGISPELEAELGAALGQPQGVRGFPEPGSARASLHKARPAVAVVALAHAGDETAADLVRELSAGGAAVVVLGERKEPEPILAAMRAGAREYLAAGEERQLAKLVQGLLDSSGALKLASVTAVVPAKGGVGGTVLATHLAGALHRRGARVCVADLDLELGDVLTFLDLPGTYTIADVAANARRLDRDLLDASVPRHRSGVAVLSQSARLAEADRIDAEGTARVIRFLRHHYGHVVLDGLRDLGDVSLAALDLADRILLVVTQDVPAVRAAQRRMELLRQLGYEPKRIALVVNRFHKGSPITKEVIEDTVGLPVRAVVGNDYKALSRAINRGVLLWEEAPRSPVARDVEALAALVCGVEAPAPGRLLARFFSPVPALDRA